MSTVSHFRLFGPSHLITLAVIVSLAVALVVLARRRQSLKLCEALSGLLAILLLSNEFIWWIIAVNLHLWSLQWGLPLQICDLAIFAAAYSLIRHNQLIWETAYFWGLGGTLQALLTPDMSFDFPQYYFFKFFITHGGVVMAVIYLAAGCGRRIDVSSVRRVFIATNLYAGFIAVINGITGANYLYLCEKPLHPSILDYLGPWPWYIFGLEAVLAVSLFIYYLPFWIVQKHENRGK